VSAELMSSMNWGRPTYPHFSATSRHLFVQHRLAKTQDIPHKLWDEMWGEAKWNWAEAQGFEHARSIPTRR
jgi:hypothetical protein